jgi:hypothetical protein
LRRYHLPGSAGAGFTAVLISDAHTTIDNPHLSAKDIIGHHNRTLAGPFVALSTAADWRF